LSSSSRSSMFFSARCVAAKRLAFSLVFNAGPEQRDEEIFAQKCVQRRLAASHNLR
jgi:hypothetical protein